MGLDMYLEAECYVGGWNHSDQAEKDKYSQLLDLTGLSRFACKAAPLAELRVMVAYWRKANAIHQWFVEQCQEGRDECQRTYIPREKLVELVDLCKRVLAEVETVEGDVSVGSTLYPDGRVEHHTKPGVVVAQPEIAKRLLPTRAGFFFGKTDYDEHYLDDLRNTIKQLEPLLSEEFHKKYSVCYRASW